MDWILNGIFKTFIGWITSVLDIYFSAILGALGVNLSVFESVFPLVKKLSIGIMAIALGVAFYIFIFCDCYLFSIGIQTVIKYFTVIYYKFFNSFAIK